MAKKTLHLQKCFLPFRLAFYHLFYSAVIPHHHQWRIRIKVFCLTIKNKCCLIYFHIINLLNHLFRSWNVLEMGETRPLAPKLPVGKLEGDRFSQWWELGRSSLLSIQWGHRHTREHGLLRTAGPDLITLPSPPQRNLLQSKAWGGHMQAGVIDGSRILSPCSYWVSIWSHFAVLQTGTESVCAPT